MRGQAVGLGGSTAVAGNIVILMPGFIGPVFADVTFQWFRVTGDLKIGAKAHIVMRTAPGTTAPAWDIMRSTNNGASFSTILPAGASNKLQMPVGQLTVDLTPAWTVTDLADGDLLRVDIVQTDDGTGADVEIVIELG